MLAPDVPHADASHCRSSRPECPMFGDVDGDGNTDRVWIRRETSCRFTLVVRTATRTLEAPIRPSCGKPSEIWSEGFPRVIALRPIDRAPGLEPEVLTWRGASNSGLLFFTLRRRRLAQLRISPEPYPRNEWNVGGFAEAFSLHDCIRPHVIGVASFSYYRRRWTIAGEIYATRGRGFVRIAHRVRRTRQPPRDATKAWPFVPGDGFEHCGGIERERP